jgi:hypothetical protein
MDGLAFYGLQAHFFPIDAEMVHGSFTSRQFVSEQRLGELGSMEDAREQGQKAIGHA